MQLNVGNLMSKSLFLSSFSFSKSLSNEKVEADRFFFIYLVTKNNLANRLSPVSDSQQILQDDYVGR